MEIFDEGELFSAIARSGARALLIGRRAMIMLGLPVLTADYDLWIASDDADKLNQALVPLGFAPNRTPEQARQLGRYALEDGEHIDVMIARAARLSDGTTLQFDDLWQRRVTVTLAPNVEISMPSLDDLIATKRIGARPKDAEDIRLLETLRTKA